ncbi:GFA family protein [Streptomyces sp. NPDC097595]|uniref:GFA family protein n=1 Tax=Streptomyces sp. NPDC097595 TaxID=3366090 RepID=UPI003805216E
MTAAPMPPSQQARTGHCQCHYITFRVLGDPIDPHLCSCPHDTRISGAPTVLWVGFDGDGLTWTGPGGEPTWYATWPTLRRGFCPRCGTHLVSVADDSDTIMVTGFSLTDRSGTDPVGHSYRQEAAPWMTIDLASPNPDPTGRSTTTGSAAPYRPSSALRSLGHRGAGRRL